MMTLGSVCLWENYVLIDENVELVARSDLKRRLDIKVPADGLLGNPFEALRKIPPRRIGGGFVRGKRRTFRH